MPCASQVKHRQPFIREHESSRTFTDSAARRPYHYKIAYSRGELAYALQILLNPALNPLQRLLNILNRVRDAEAQIALTEITKGRAGQGSNTTLIEQRVG